VLDVHELVELTTGTMRRALGQEYRGWTTQATIGAVTRVF
jgi:hypothetical protein